MFSKSCMHLFAFLTFALVNLRSDFVLAQKDKNVITEEHPVEMMTTLEPIDANNENKSCLKYGNCEECEKFNCYWILCVGEYSCADQPAEMCPEVACANTTSEAPTTTPVTTLSPNETTTEPPTTHETTIPTTEPANTTTTSTTTTATTPTTTVAPITTTATPSPHVRHFDATSFVGGIILAFTGMAISFAAWKFYRKRSLATSYTNF